MRLSRGDVLVFTDDDARFEADWLGSGRQGSRKSGGDYVGGKVLPIWGGPQPGWLPNRPATQWAVIALLDYGPEQLEFGRGKVGEALE